MSTAGRGYRAYLTIGPRLLRSMFRTAVDWLVSSRGSLKERTTRGGIWLLLGDGLNRAAGLLKLAVLGRLLAPRDFGLLGIALLVQQLIESFSQTGISSALIHKRGEIQDYLNSAWTVQIIRGSAIAALLFLAAPCPS